jgi:predicted CoA-binding protein
MGSPRQARSTLFLIVFTDLIGFGIIIPLLPLYAESYHPAPWVFGLLMACYSAMQFVFSPILGRLSDRVGRRPVVLMVASASKATTPRSARQFESERSQDRLSRRNLRYNRVPEGAMGEQACEFPASNASNEEIDAILAGARTIAVVGLSDKPDRDSYRVAAYLQQHGYRIIPVNPAASEILGERACPELAAIPSEVSVDVVDIFRKPELIPPIVDQAIARGAKVVWMQLGLAHNAAAVKARAAGLRVVMDRCTKIEHASWSAAR